MSTQANVTEQQNREKAARILAEVCGNCANMTARLARQTPGPFDPTQNDVRSLGAMLAEVSKMLPEGA